jgi:hypothetical protein
LLTVREAREGNRWDHYGYIEINTADTRNQRDIYAIAGIRIEIHAEKRCVTQN